MIYTQQLSNQTETWFSFDLTCGVHQLTVTMLWDNIVSDQYNELVTVLNRSAAEDPLIDSDGNIVRDYDYIEYYKAIPEEIGPWLAEQTSLPQSLRGLSVPAATVQIVARKEQVIEWEEELNQILDMLLWHVKIRDAYDGREYTGMLTLGGWYYSQSDVLRFRFTAPRDSIGRNDLNVVTLEVEVF